MQSIEKVLIGLAEAGNLRTIPAEDAPSGQIDLTTNDYLGFLADGVLVADFLAKLRGPEFLPGSAASRLLSPSQRYYTALEAGIAEAYNAHGGEPREVLMFNSGYHANTGIMRALASRGTLFLADHLVHASVIDGLALAAGTGATWRRFRHNDTAHLRQLVERHAAGFDRVVIVAESVYSMDGDVAPVAELAEIRDSHPGAMLVLDEAHAVGVLGPQGLGVARSLPCYDSVDIVVGTLGKALASMGAYAVVRSKLREYLVNTARSLIFSTALPPVTARWSLTTFTASLAADDRRQKLWEAARVLAPVTGADLDAMPGHIQPLITGTPQSAVALSRRYVEEAGIHVLPIRTPTVPAGTDRLRFSLNAAISATELAKALEKVR